MKDKKKKWIVPPILSLGFMLLAVTMVLLGLLQGDYHETLNKAIRVCLECIGIG